MTEYDVRRAYKCPNCGASVPINDEINETIKCPYCETEIKRDIQRMIKVQALRKREEYIDVEEPEIKKIKLGRWFFIYLVIAGALIIASDTVTRGTQAYRTVSDIRSAFVIIGGCILLLLLVLREIGGGLFYIGNIIRKIHIKRRLKRK